MIESGAERTARDLGLGTVPYSVTRLVKDQVSEQGRGLVSHSGIVERFRLGKLVGATFANKHFRDMANAIDQANCEALWNLTVRTNVAQARRELRASALSRLPAGVDAARFNEVWDNLPALFSSDDVRRAFRELDQRFADRLARDWQNGLGKINDLAREEVVRVFFAGTETNADAILRRVILFHYWMSRATPLYLEAALRNPGMLNAYTNMIEGMEKAAEQGNYPPAVKGFVELMGTTMGYTIFIRPDALFQTFLVFGQEAGFAPDGESWLGKFTRKSRLFFNPLISTLLNISGASGDTFPADPLAIERLLRFVQNGLDLAKSRGLIENTGPTGNFYDELMGRARDVVSGGTSDILPGLFSHVPYKDSNLLANREISQLVVDVANDEGVPVWVPHPTDPNGQPVMNPIVLAAMDDADSALYQEAFSRYAEQNALDTVARVLPIGVLYPRSRVTSADARTATIETAPQGSTELDRAYAERTATNITDQAARDLFAQQEDYYALGTPEQRAALSTYNGIKYGNLGPYAVVTIGDKPYDPNQINRMSDAERSVLADQWARSSNNVDDIVAIQTGQDAYDAEHPAWAAYDAWRSSVYDYTGGVAQYWQDVATGNPNAARWIESQELPDDPAERERLLTSAGAYLAVQGERQTYREPDPIATRDMSQVPYDPTAVTVGTGQEQAYQGPTEQSILEDLATSEQERAAYNGILSAHFGQPVDIDLVNPMARSAIIQNVEAAYGIRPPEMSWDARDYIKWASAQESGTDSSIAAYLEWRARSQFGGFGGLTSPLTSAAANTSAGSPNVSELLAIVRGGSGAAPPAGRGDIDALLHILGAP